MHPLQAQGLAAATARRRPPLRPSCAALSCRRRASSRHGTPDPCYLHRAPSPPYRPLPWLSLLQLAPAPRPLPASPSFCPAAAWRWRCSWCAAPPCCCWTSRWRGWTGARAASSSGCWAGSSPSAPCWWCHTTSGSWHHWWVGGWVGASVEGCVCVVVVYVGVWGCCLRGRCRRRHLPPMRGAAGAGSGTGASQPGLRSKEGDRERRLFVQGWRAVLQALTGVGQQQQRCPARPPAHAG